MSRKEDFFQTLEASTPALRRYARALLVGASAGETDDLVHAALGAIAKRLRSKELQPADASEARLAAYASLNDFALRHARAFSPVADPHKSAIAQSLAELPLDERMTLLLVALEGFSYDDAGRILQSTRETMVTRLSRARAALASMEIKALAVSDGPRRVGAHLRLVK
jgi:DNA-directed RNA polymerase specialized sigma24 family protein